MKKYLGLLVMMMMVVFPLTAKADTEVQNPIPCTTSNGVKTCTIIVNTDENDLSFTLTEKGGANITGVEAVDWNISNTPADSNGVWTVELNGINTGEVSLFKFTYEVSGEEDCGVTVRLGEKTIVIEEDPTPNPKTGVSLPYVALGMIALLAGGAYIATKDKAKMYRL